MFVLAVLHTSLSSLNGDTIRIFCVFYNSNFYLIFQLWDNFLPTNVMLICKPDIFKVSQGLKMQHCSQMCSRPILKKNIYIVSRLSNYRRTHTFAISNVILSSNGMKKIHACTYTRTHTHRQRHTHWCLFDMLIGSISTRALQVSNLQLFCVFVCRTVELFDCVST